MPTPATTARSSAAFIATLGVQTHLNYDSAWGTPNSPYANLTAVEAALSYLNPNGANTGINTIRDAAFYGNELLKLQTLGSLGYKLDLFMAYDSSHTSYTAEYATIGSLISSGYVRLVEGALEVDNGAWGLVNGDQYVAQNGGTFTGWSAAIAMQRDIYSLFHNKVPVALFSIAIPVDGAANGPAAQAAAQFGTNVASLADYGNVHFYQHNGDAPASPSGGELVGTVSQETGEMVGRPFVITETGFNDSGLSGVSYKGTPDVNAKYTLDLVLDSFKVGSTLTVLYELFDDNVGYTGGNAFEDHWGLFNADGTPKEAAVALHNMLGVLSDTRSNSTSFTPGSLSMQISGLPSSGNTLLLQKADGVYELILWNDANIYHNGVASSVPPSNVSVGLPSPATIKIYDPMQNAALEAGKTDFLTNTPLLQPISAYANATSALMSLTDHPIIVEITPSQGVPTPTPPPTPVPTPTPDTLTLRISEDEYAGDAQFTVSVNGHQVGATMTASALHSSGDANVYQLTGRWGANAQVRIAFINDAWGGTSSTDRNLYINSVSYDGKTYAGAPLYSNSIATVPMGGVSTAASPSDVLTVHLSEDAYQGSANFKLLIDGKVATTPQPVTALHNAGVWEDLTFAGNFGAGTHSVGIVFTNDSYGGTSSTDRNLYVNGIDIGGTHYGNGVSSLLSTGSTATYTISTLS